MARNIFVKAYDEGPDFTGEVWPTDAVYPDFFNADAVKWWQENLETLYGTLKFDGLWQDMNEASNFCNGPCYTEQLAESPQKHKLPYTPTGRDLETKSIALDAWHNTSDPATVVTELDAHSLFGTMQVMASNSWFANKGKRAMIIGRSAYAGYGKFASRWLGDNFSSYEYLGYSVTGVMMHNIIGIPLVGADICGFGGDSWAELCARWYTVGAFYPFSRNHNALGSVPQEPYVWNNASYLYPTYKTSEFIRLQMRTKLALIPYYYSEIRHASNHGGAFFKPVFFEFPKDQDAYKNLTHNVMLGKQLKVSFQSTENETKEWTDYYFPEGDWCPIFNTSLGCITGPANVSLPSRIYQSHVHLISGGIVPLMTDLVEKDNHNVTNTHGIQQLPIDLHIHPKYDAVINGGNCNASGRFLNDDGEVADPEGNENIYKLDFYSLCDPGTKSMEMTLAINQTATNTTVDPTSND